MNQFDSHIWAIGGGKGGVGKSFLASNLACGLAFNGYKVILVDADLGGANIHTLFGINRPEKTLSDFLKKKVARFSDILIPTSTKDVHLICGASAFLEVSNPKYAQKQKLLKAIAGLRADYVLIDIGAGANLNNLDFFNMADLGILVTTPSPTAIQNAYSFLKMAVHRKILNFLQTGSLLRNEVLAALEGDEKKTLPEVLQLIQETDADLGSKIVSTLQNQSSSLIINMATEVEGEKVSKAVSAAAYQFLRVQLPYAGRIVYDRSVENSIRQMKPIMLAANAPLSNSIFSLVRRLLAAQSQEGSEPQKTSAPTEQQNTSRFQLGLNDEVIYDGTKMHVQTEDLGTEKGEILTIVFHGGRVLFSKTLDYQELLGHPDFRKRVVKMVRRQHKTVIAGIQAGKLKDKLQASGVV